MQKNLAPLYLGRGTNILRGLLLKNHLDRSFPDVRAVSHCFIIALASKIVEPPVKSGRFITNGLIIEQILSATDAERQAECGRINDGVGKGKYCRGVRIVDD